MLQKKKTKRKTTKKAETKLLCAQTQSSRKDWILLKEWHINISGDVEQRVAHAEEEEAGHENRKREKRKWKKKKKEKKRNCVPKKIKLSLKKQKNQRKHARDTFSIGTTMNLEPKV